jgi:hypothetical protein
MKKIIPFVLILFSMACNSRAKDTNSLKDTIPAVDDTLRIQLETEKQKIAANMASRELTYFIIKVPDEKFGYSIYIDGRMYIEQKTIPAVQGNNGFVNKEDAEKVAKWVIEKIKEGEMPPTVTLEDLKKLNVIPK